MENQIDSLLESITLNFPNVYFEVIHNSLSPTLKHFVIKDQDGNKGFGTDHDYKTCIEKAYSEYIERMTFHELNKMFKNFRSSNGFAAHISAQKAKETSQRELIERDALLVTWHGKIAPYWLTNDEANKTLNPQNLRVKKMHEKFGLVLSFGILATTKNIITCIAKVEGKYNKKDFFFIDTKAGINLIEIINGLLESISFYSHFIATGFLKTKKMKVNNLNQPMDHFYYYLDQNHDLTWFHQGSKDVIEIPSKKIYSYLIKTEDIIGSKKLNRFVSYSESDHMQPYYCGKFHIKNINTARFKSIFDKYFKYNTQPHPLS